MIPRWVDRHQPELSIVPILSNVSVNGFVAVEHCRKTAGTAQEGPEILGTQVDSASDALRLSRVCQVQASSSDRQRRIELPRRPFKFRSQYLISP